MEMLGHNSFIPRVRDRAYVGPSQICARGFFAKLFNRHERGLFAKTDIEMGEIIGRYKGPEITPSLLRELDVETTYVLWSNKVSVNGEPTGILGENLLRFANHSRDQFNMVHYDDLFYAQRDIKAGEELTWRYGNFEY